MTLTPRVISYRGAQDGIRWGDMRFGGQVCRRFTHDLISDTVRLYNHPRNIDADCNGPFVEDVDPERIAAAWGAITRLTA